MKYPRLVHKIFNTYALFYTWAMAQQTAIVGGEAGPILKSGQLVGIIEGEILLLIVQDVTNVTQLFINSTTFDSESSAVVVLKDARLQTPVELVTGTGSGVTTTTVSTGVTAIASKTTLQWSADDISNLTAGTFLDVYVKDDVKLDGNGINLYYNSVLTPGPITLMNRSHYYLVAVGINSVEIVGSLRNVEAELTSLDSRLDTVEPNVTALLANSTNESTVQALGDLAGDTTILASAGESATATITANAVLTVTASKAVQKVTLLLTNAGAFTTTIANSIWAGGAPPVFSAAGLDVVELRTFNNGTTWIGTAILDVR